MRLYWGKRIVGSFVVNKTHKNDQTQQKLLQKSSNTLQNKWLSKPLFQPLCLVVEFSIFLPIIDRAFCSPCVHPRENSTYPQYFQSRLQYAGHYFTRINFDAAIFLEVDRRTTRDSLHGDNITLGWKRKREFQGNTMAAFFYINSLRITGVMSHYFSPLPYRETDNNADGQSIAPLPLSSRALHCRELSVIFHPLVLFTSCVIARRVTFNPLPRQCVLHGNALQPSFFELTRQKSSRDSMYIFKRW